MDLFEQDLIKSGLSDKTVLRHLRNVDFYIITLDSSADLPLNEQKLYNGGYLFLQDVYYELGLDKICRAISNKHSFKYDLNSILSRLIYTRILYPSSKKTSFEESKKFIEQPNFELHDIYRALSVIAEESDYIQRRLFKNSSQLCARKTGVIYYDCTNFYFEIEEAEDDKQYGACKENRRQSKICNYRTAAHCLILHKIQRLSSFNKESSGHTCRINDC